jgi:hypothetical protein
MKLTGHVTSAFPAALAIGSVALVLVVLPSGAPPARSSSVPPVLRLAAGEVVAAVTAPLRAITSTHSGTADAHAVRTAQHRSSSSQRQASASGAGTRSGTPHRPVRHHHALRSPAVAHALVTTVVQSTLKPASPVTKHGKGKGVGHLRKLAAPPTPVTQSPQSDQANHGRGHAYGHRPDVPHGPPVVPPGHDPNGPGASRHGAPGVRGGGKK